MGCNGEGGLSDSLLWVVVDCRVSICRSGVDTFIVLANLLPQEASTESMAVSDHPPMVITLEDMGTMKLLTTWSLPSCLASDDYADCNAIHK